MIINSNELIQQLCTALYLAEQIDVLHLSVTALTNSIESGELDLFLEESHKSPTQKRLYLEKLLATIRSVELRDILTIPYKNLDYNFFLRDNLAAWLSDVDQTVEGITIIRLQVATQFKEKDLHQFITILQQQLKAPLALDISVEPALLGGVIIQYGSYITDYSLTSRLAQFRDNWKEAAFTHKV